MDETLTYEILKTKQRGLRDGFPENLALRVHRALSWLQRAEKETNDPDAAFIVYWIGFNAIYAEGGKQHKLQEPSHRNRLKGNPALVKYFDKVVTLDTDSRIYSAIWNKYAGPIRVLLNNKYVFEPFWKHQNRRPGNKDWEIQFKKSLGRVKYALKNKETDVLLSILFSRLYVLRNQLIHGGATWAGIVNRDQVRDGTEIMAFLLPLLIDIMMDNPDKAWGKYHYPVVE